MAMARAALSMVDEVLFVLPRIFPHKSYTGAGFDLRLELLKRAAAGQSQYSIAASERGLFTEIAKECRLEYGGETELFFLCGRDAAERIVHWDYGTADSIVKQLDTFRLLVASRNGEYQPPPEIRKRVHTVAIPEDCDGISSTEVRHRMGRGEAWEHLVPRSIVPLMKSQQAIWRNFVLDSS